MKPEIIEKWNKKAQNILLGRKITSVRYASDEEMESMGITTRPLIIALDNEMVIIPMQDDEGNGAGALWLRDYTTNKEDNLPVLY